MIFHKILAPIDFSERSVAAARYAGELGRCFAAELVFVHVMEPLPVDYAMHEPSRVLLSDFGKERRSKAESQLNAVMPDLPQAKRILAEGEAADTIVQVANQEKADLIVMPTQGRNRIRRFLIGSVTAKVLHDCPIPVWTGVHLEHEADFPPLLVKNVLCATDFGQQSEAVLNYGSQVASHLQAAISAIHIIAPGENEQAAHEKLHASVKKIAPNAACLIEHGEPQNVIPAKARDLKADLIVIGRGSSTDLMGRLRAQAYGIVRQAPCPVLSV
jgi:nucleotide-binding universal stress UspA family protein